MAVNLSPELLDLIFAYVGPVLRFSHGVVVLETSSLKRASLVHSRWRLAAQKRLQYVLNIHNEEDCMAVAQCIHNGALQTQNVRIIVATLGNREPSFRQPFSSTTLMEQVALMPNIREAYIRTHSQHRDVDLAAMLAVMDKLETLSLTYVKPSFARYIDSDAEDEYDSEEDDLLGDSLYEYDEWDEPFKDEADGTLLLQETLPELPRLKHLFFKNFSFREAEMVMDDCRLYNLVSLSLDRILIIEAMLSWLISPFCRLKYLMLQDLEGISKASLLSIIQPHCPHLKELAFHLPWVPTQAIGSMPPSHPMPSQLLGSSNDILVKCSSLQVLSLQDRSFSIETMGFMPSLHSLYIDTRKLPDPIVFSATDRLPRLETLRVYTHEEAFIPVLENQDFARFSMIMDERGVDGRAYAVNLDATGHRFVPDFPQYLLSPFI